MILTELFVEILDDKVILTELFVEIMDDVVILTELFVEILDDKVRVTDRFAIVLNPRNLALRSRSSFGCKLQTNSTLVPFS